MLERRSTAPAVAVAVMFAACSSPRTGPDPASVVATIDGVPVLISAFEDYAAVRFVEDGLDEPMAPSDSDRVRSRLFDDFVAENLLVVEAERRGVVVSDAEISSWLGDEDESDPARASARRVQARRELATHRLLDAWMRAEVKAQGKASRPQAADGDAAERLAAALRGRYKIRLHPEALPFRYIPETPAERPSR